MDNEKENEDERGDITDEPESGFVAAQNAVVLCRERLLVNLDPTMALNGLVGRLRIACRAR